MEHNMKCSGELFELIKNNVKIIEGRVNDKKRQQIKIGDYIIFNNENGEKLKKKIKDKLVFSSFDEALRTVKLKDILPTVRTMEEGVELYHSFSGYTEEEKLYGVVLFWLEN
jgi:ASC-1-like (ASCH) protein